MSETSPVRLFMVVLLLGAILILWNLGGSDLTHWDEGRTAERAREILVFNDWVTMHLNYQADFAKPPLYYWLTALLYRIVGVNEFAARFWAALFGILGLYAVHRLGALLFSATVGAGAAALLLTVTLYLEYARTAMLDTGLLSFGVLALCAFLSHSFLLGWAFLGIGFMLKGAWVFFYLLPLPAWWFTQNRWQALRDPRLYLGVGIFLAIVLPWHLAQYALHGQAFLKAYVGHEIMERIQQPLNGHEGNSLFYLKQLMDKWHVWFYWFVIGHCVVGWRGQDGKKLAFLDLWILAVLLVLHFFINTKMIRYTLVIYPAIAIMVAYFILYALEHLRWGKRLLVLSGTIALALFVHNRDVLLSRNADLRALGLAVQRYAEDAQAIVVFRIIEPGLGFYCRRPVRWVWSHEELGQSMQEGSLLIADKADSLSRVAEQQGITLRVLYQGSTYTLIAPSQIPKSTASVTTFDRAGLILLPAYPQNRGSAQSHRHLTRGQFLSAPGQKSPAS
ncbi:MAG TPA: glycosyltransferase family 39 protein [Candidatus Binatia bacterium]|jgi:hypothetical protein|nr:glycosyltransferase family 39 protein [Candidatus Binatia bacterium]